MTGAPDLINPLPVLRAFKAVEGQAGLKSEVIRMRIGMDFAGPRSTLPPVVISRSVMPSASSRPPRS